MTKRISQMNLSWRATAIILALLALFMGITVVFSSHPPVIDQRIGETTLRFTADRAWSLLPGDCVTLRWQAEGIESLHVEGDGVIGQGEKAFCPSISDKTARFTVSAPDGLYREYDLRIHFLPDLLFYLAALIGVLGSLAIIALLVLTNRMDRAWNLRWVAVCLALLVVAGTALRLNEPQPPRLEADDGQVKVAMWAENSSSALPQEPVEVEFSVAGAESVRYLGEPVRLRDGKRKELNFRDAHGEAFRLEVLGADGKARVYEMTIPSLFGALRHIPVFYYWSLLALLLAAIVYLPMAWQKTLAARKRRDWTDAAALGGFAFLSLTLAAPFGLDSPPIWEDWTIWAYFDGALDQYVDELRLRFFLALPTSLAHFVHNDSYIGFHLLHLATLTLLPALLYATLRKLGVRALYAFLLAALVFAYPVNELRMSPRFLVNNTSIMWLLLAAYCALDWLDGGRRRSLAGAALALLFNVGSYEMGLAMVAAAPFFLWLRPGKRDWRRVNLSLLFWCAAAFKLCYMALLMITDRPLYGSHLAAELVGGRVAANEPSLLDTLFGRLAQVYHRVFITGWGDALSTLREGGGGVLPSVVALVGIGAVCLWLARRDGPASRLSLRSIALALAGGLCLIVPAVILFLPTHYGEGEMERIMFYAPFGGAIAAFSLLLLVARHFPPRWRDSALIALCLILLLPGLSWLYAQQDRWTRVADNQGRVFRQIVESVPRPLPGVDMMLISEMTEAEARANRVQWLPVRTLTDNALRVLYQDDAPANVYMCWRFRHCPVFASGAAAPTRESDLQLWQRRIYLELHGDMTVELLDNPAARLGWNIQFDYDASRLHDAGAPIPARARTILSRLGPGFEPGQ